MDNLPVLICFGTRPEWLKIKPLLSVIPKEEYKLLFTGQHTDLVKGVDVDYNIEISSESDRLSDIISSCLIQFPNNGGGEFSSVLVQGDTASALGCALVAYNRKIPIFYLEAGLRSYDLENPYPEEGYRQMISRIATYNMCPTELALKRLIDEKTLGWVGNTGNTVLDNLLSYKEKSKYGNKVLITLHRRENLEEMWKWFFMLESLASENTDLEFIFPMHPNPEIQKKSDIFKFVKVVEALPHEQLLDILVESLFVITDSGGLQEEGSFFNKKVIVCRKTTERPEGIDTGHLYICKEPKALPEIFSTLRKDYKINNPCPYGDGNASSKVYTILKHESV